jgi:EAL and modified HD-GYP domain-containing signal transduction protein
MVRARFCELLAEAAGRRREGGALFMAGLFSLLDALTRTPMSEVVDRLDLAPELRAALLAREGPHAGMLRLAEAYESGDWDAVFAGARAADVPLDDLPERYAQAVVWAGERAAETAA